MHLLFPLLLLEVAAQHATPAIPGREVCANPADDDARPYTLCLAESSFEQAEAELERQLEVTLARVEAAEGANAADRLGDEQLEWVKRRNSECEAQAADSPSTQVARNTLGCQTQWTEMRTAELKALTAPK